MLPFTADQVEFGLKAIESFGGYAILSAWSEPAKFAKIDLPDRETQENESLLETYSVGGFRFCRKIPELVAPQELVKGYDGVFCRHLWKEHGYRVGYLKKSRALFRSLCKNYESVAIKIQGTPVDPYHDEDNIKDFLVYLLEHEVEE